MRPIALLFILALTTSLSHAQNRDEILKSLQETPAIAVTEEMRSFNGSVAPCFSIILHCEADAYDKYLRSNLKKNYQITTKKSQGFFTAKSVLVQAWYPDTINVYHTMEKDGDAVRLILHVSSRDHFIGASDPAWSVISADLVKLTNQFYIGYYDVLIRDQQREYDKQKRDFSKLESASIKIEREIETADKQEKNAHSESENVKDKIHNNEKEEDILKEELQQIKSERDQVQKELDMKTSEVTSVQKEYDGYNYRGELGTKPAEKVAKELARKKDDLEKAREKVSEKNQDITDQENRILDQKRHQNELNTEQDDAEKQAQRFSHEKKDWEDRRHENERDQNDKKELVTHALSLLENLKRAKSGLNPGQ